MLVQTHHAGHYTRLSKLSILADVAMVRALKFRPLGSRLSEQIRVFLHILALSFHPDDENPA